MASFGARRAGTSGLSGEIPYKAAMDPRLKERSTASHSSLCSSKTAPMGRGPERAFGKLPTTLCLHYLAVPPLDDVRRADPPPVRPRERQVREHILRSLPEKLSRLGVLALAIPRHHLELLLRGSLVSSPWALHALEKDPDRRVIALVSKPPGVATLAWLRERLVQCPKSVVGCFLAGQEGVGTWNRVQRASTLDEAAPQAVGLLGGERGRTGGGEASAVGERLAAERERMAEGQKYLRGPFAGGTCWDEAQCVLAQGGWWCTPTCHSIQRLRFLNPQGAWDTPESISETRCSPKAALIP